MFIATPTSACARAGRVVGAVARHRDEVAAALLALDERELLLRSRLGEEPVEPGFLGDGGGCERVVAGDHHGADAEATQLVEPLAKPGLHDVLEPDHAEDASPVGDDEGRAPSLEIDSTNSVSSGGTEPPCSAT